MTRIKLPEIDHQIDDTNINRTIDSTNNKSDEPNINLDPQIN